MPFPTQPGNTPQHPTIPPICGRVWRLSGACLAGIWVLAACDRPGPKPVPPEQAAIPEETANASAEPQCLARDLAAARTRLAAIAVERSSPDEALALLAGALEADPGSSAARELARRILGSTRWNLPDLELAHPFPIEGIFFPDEASLWVGLSGTITRWDLEELETQATLFPAPKPGAEIRSWVAGPGVDAMIIEREGVALLCDAQTLKPRGDIGPLPESITAAAAVAFSPDGLLLAHPALAEGAGGSIVWHLRDAKSGGIIRSSEATGPQAPAPLAATLDRRQLRVLHADGSLMEMPVSPLEEIRHSPGGQGTLLIHALFAADGGSAMVLRDKGPHLPPTRETLSLDGGLDGNFDDWALLEAHPWNRQPSLWSGLLADAASPLLWVEGNRLDVLTGGLAPLHAAGAITAVAFRGDRVAVGSENGDLTIHRILPPPRVLTDLGEAGVFDSEALAAFTALTGALAGTRCGEDGIAIERLSAAGREQAIKDCDFGVIKRVFPDLDFARPAALLEGHAARKAEPGALASFRARLARAGGEPPPESPAKALESALASEDPQRIEDSLKGVDHVPVLLKRLAVSRIAWLQNRKADAMAVWPDGFPDLGQVRLREDWDGWEQADFSPALQALKEGVEDELAALVVPPDSTPEQRGEVFARLTDQSTIHIVGRIRLASACLQAALALSEFTDETERTFKLASLARNLGEDPAPCLRAEAMALTALGDYEKAHQRWIMLISDYPVSSHLPGDYAEASYTAFENADPRQAMAILTTGLHRFPNDGNFALRAGWVALLTGNAERAYRFLLTGRQIGYPPEKLENAIALLAIAAVQTGAVEDAAVFYQDLINLDPAWENPETIESLEWPEELKSSLRQLVW